MLTATVACQPLPGPPGAAWPAEPGVTCCFPYPACCRPSAAGAAPDRWSWLHTTLVTAAPDVALYAIASLLAVAVALCIDTGPMQRRS